MHLIVRPLFSPVHERAAVVIEDCIDLVADQLTEHGGFERIELPALVAVLLPVLPVPSASVGALGRVRRRAVLLDLGPGEREATDRDALVPARVSVPTHRLDLCDQLVSRHVAAEPIGLVAHPIVE